MKNSRTSLKQKRNPYGFQDTLSSSSGHSEPDDGLNIHLQHRAQRLNQTFVIQVPN